MAEQKIADSPLLAMPDDCRTGHFIRRVKRFSIELECQGANIWAHTNNSGAMLGVLSENAPLLISPAPSPKRKLPFTVEAVWHSQKHASMESGFWIGVNTLTPNRLLEAAFHAGLLQFAKRYTSFRREAPYGKSRLDARITGSGLPDLWVECKNVTLVRNGIALFPDAQSARARKHLAELTGIVASGHRAAMFFLIQRPDAHGFAPAADIDPDYARDFYLALEKGVEAYASVAHVRPEGIFPGPALPLIR